MSTLPTGLPLFDRLSVTKRSNQPPRPLTSYELDTLRTVADALIPIAEDKPSGGAITEFDRLANEALTILDRQFDDIIDTLAELPSVGAADMYSRLRGLSNADPARFYTLSLVVVAVYLYSKETSDKLEYPRPHRNPPYPMDAANELKSGILNPVIQRGPVYVGLTREHVRRAALSPKEASPRTAEVVAGLVGDVAAG